MIGKINVGGGGGGLEINGIIESYVASAGGGISAGDFVTFVNDWGAGTDTQLLSASGASGISAVALSYNKVFIAYYESYLYGVVCTISGTTITPGTRTQLLSASGASSSISAVALSDNKVFIAYYNNSYNNTYLYGLVCTISDTTITAGTNTRLTNNLGSGLYPSVAALSGSKVFIAYCNNNDDHYLYGVVCTISGTTITPGTIAQLSNTSWTYDISVVALNYSKVFIAYYESYLYGVVCTISGTTITPGTRTQLSSNYKSGISMVALSDSKVFIAYRYSSGDYYYYLYGLVCTISGTATITPGTNTQLSSHYSTSTWSVSISAVALSDSKVFIAHNIGTSDSSVYYLYGVVCTISGTTITPGTRTQLSSGGSFSGLSLAAAVALSDSKVFIAHDFKGASYLYSLIATAQVKTISNKADAIAGVAKTSAAAGASVDVYIPNV